MVHFEEIINNWELTSNCLSPPQNEHDLKRMTDFADFLIDKIENTENDNLENLLHIVGTLIFEYENKFIPEPQGTPIECLKYLIDEHNLNQKDLTEIGSPHIISEIMQGKRKLNKRQTIALVKRFHCSSATFL